MKLTVLYHPNSDNSRLVEDYIHDFRRLHDGVDVDMVDVDSAEGIHQAEVYDILEYPAIVVTSYDGSLLNIWSGAEMPLMDEVAGYLKS